ncbi:hypothetical protein, partial [Methylovulum miyakonense]|uniref:hypothetical protein n=1 Tax=Methylovulum miyakonense TaxID=645578 RepID=UPI001E57F364
AGIGVARKERSGLRGSKPDNSQFREPVPEQCDDKRHVVAEKSRNPFHDIQGFEIASFPISTPVPNQHDSIRHGGVGKSRKKAGIGVARMQR